MVCLSDGLSVWWFVFLVVCLSDDLSVWWFVFLMVNLSGVFSRLCFAFCLSVFFSVSDVCGLMMSTQGVMSVWQ